MTEKAHAFRRRVLVNAASTGAANVWAMVVALASLPLLLHGLGAPAFGLWVLIQTLSAVNGWMSLADLGVGAATTLAVGQRLGRDDREGVAGAVRTSLGVFAGLGLVFGGLVSLVGPHILPGIFRTPTHLRADVRFALIVFGAQVLVDTVTEGCESCLEGLQRVDMSRLVDAIRRTLVAAACAAVAVAGGGLRGVAATSLAASVAGLGAALVALRRYAPRVPGRFDRDAVRPLIGYGIRVATVDASGVVNRTIDRLLIGAFIGPSAVALVEIATQIMNGASATMSGASYPVVSGAALLAGRDDPKATRQLLQQGTLLTVLVTWPVVVTAALLAHPLVRLWVGRRYLDASGLTVVALLDVALVAPVTVGSNILRGAGQISLVLRPALLAVAANLVASVVLIKTVGTVGTFIGTIVGAGLLVPLLARSVLRELHVHPVDFLRSSILPAIAPVGALTAVLLVVRALSVGDAAMVAIGVVGGGATFIAVALRTAIKPAELVDLVRGDRVPR